MLARNMLSRNKRVVRFVEPFQPGCRGAIPAAFVGSSRYPVKLSGVGNSKYPPSLEAWQLDL